MLKAELDDSGLVCVCVCVCVCAHGHMVGVKGMLTLTMV